MCRPVGSAGKICMSWRFLHAEFTCSQLGARLVSVHNYITCFALLPVPSLWADGACAVDKEEAVHLQIDEQAPIAADIQWSYVTEIPHPNN